MTTPTTTLLKPYKFLKQYEFEDREIFFGRDRESEILLSDVIATRLVVLFAKTGSGKTSLINAGVRPRLEDLDYATFYIRVKKDPIASMREALGENNMPVSDHPALRLDIQLEQIVDQIQKPIVLFFDQFEEFFLYAIKDRPEEARQFISDVARIYRSRDSGTHIVFSMREEFFVEMDAFRDEIPSIFHSDSNLRLRWFLPEQAQDAIVLPAKRLGVTPEESLVKRLLQDLQQDGRIEPARLQIVCDTLWEQPPESRLTLAAYEKLGGAERIMDRRLVQDITANLDDQMLQLLDQLLPELITERGTKYVRGFDELAKNLKWDPNLLEKLVGQLSALGLVSASVHSDARFFEWTSDYVAEPERTGRLQRRIRTLLLTRQLQAAMDKARETAKELVEIKAGQLTYQQRDVRYLSDEIFETFSNNSELLRDLDREQAEFIFLAALEHGNSLLLWFNLAAARAVPVWEILRDRITNDTARIEQAESAVRLLGELKDSQVMELLAAALETETLSALTIKVLGRMQTAEAFQLLEEALKQEALAPQVLAVLAQSGDPQAVALLQSALQQAELAQRAERELDRISKSKSTQASDYAGQVLEKYKTQSRSSPVQSSYQPAKGFSDSDWANLLRRIQSGRCTPMIGPQVLEGALPSRAEIAYRWAAEVNAPLSRTDDLPQVAQYLSVQYDARYASEKLAHELSQDLENAKQQSQNTNEEWNAVVELYRTLAQLPMSLYLTTNYDSLLEDALAMLSKRPIHQLLRWNKRIDYMSSEAEGDFYPTPDSPLVLHLFGSLEEPRSIVLTEDNYLDYLTTLASNPDVLAPSVQKALASTQLMFIGFDFLDPSLRILLKSLTSFSQRSITRSGVIVQMLPSQEQTSWTWERYIEEYYARIGLQVYWGTPRRFTQELGQRWKDFHYG